MGDTAVPQVLYLAPPAPNPSAPTTAIVYGIPGDASGSHVRLRVFDAEGRAVATLVNEAQGPVMAEVDVNRMKQVFWNLATNSLKAMPDGGVLTIDVGVLDSGEVVEVRFSDNGQGMNENEIEKYFQPFHGHFEEGSGLGAAIVYRLVQEHGGRIVADDWDRCIG